MIGPPCGLSLPRMVIQSPDVISARTVRPCTRWNLSSCQKYAANRPNATAAVPSYVLAISEGRRLIWADHQASYMIQMGAQQLWCTTHVCKALASGQTIRGNVVTSCSCLVTTLCNSRLLSRRGYGRKTKNESPTRSALSKKSFRSLSSRMWTCYCWEETYTTIISPPELH